VKPGWPYPKAEWSPFDTAPELQGWRNWALICDISAQKGHKKPEKGPESASFDYQSVNS
jgi:hypothetical protein